MLRLTRAELPLEAARVAYALKPVPAQKILDCNPQQTGVPIKFDHVSASLGLRVRPLRPDYIPPTLELFGCTPEGLPKPELVHELFVNTRRSGDDDQMGPIIARWLRLMFAPTERVFVLPITGGDDKAETCSWVFFTFDGPQKAMVLAWNGTKHRRLNKDKGPMRDYPFLWTKSIPGSYVVFCGENGRQSWLDIKAVQAMFQGNLSQRDEDCLTGVSADEIERMPVRSEDFIPLLKEIMQKLRGDEFGKFGHFQLISESNVFDSRLVELFDKANAFPLVVQHELMADLANTPAKLDKLRDDDAVDFLRGTFKKSEQSDEVADAMATVLLNKISEL